MSNFQTRIYKLQTSHTICNTITCNHWNIWHSFKLHFALWILALHQKKRITALPPTKEAVTTFLSMRINWFCGQINWMLFEHHTCVFYSSVGITMQGPILPLFFEITTLISSVRFEWVIQMIGNLISKTTRFVLSLNCCTCWAWRFYLNQLWIELWEVQNFISVNFISWLIS